MIALTSICWPRRSKQSWVALLACLIAVKKQHGFSEVPEQKFFLSLGQRATEKSDAGIAGLMHLHAVEKSFDQNYLFGFSERSVKIEEQM